MTASDGRAFTSGGIWKGAMIGAAAGAIANVVLYLAASASGVSMVAEFQKGEPPLVMPLPPVVIASFVPAILAALAAMLMNRISPKAPQILVAVAVVFGLLSMGGPATLAGASSGLRIVLALMHVVSAVTITGGILRWGKA